MQEYRVNAVSLLVRPRNLMGYVPPMVKGSLPLSFDRVPFLHTRCARTRYLGTSESGSIRASFERAGFFGSKRPHQIFGSRNEAIEWCEDMLLMHREVGRTSAYDLESWLTREFGRTAEVSRITIYLRRHQLAAGEALFRQGDPADSVEILASGRLVITGKDEQGCRTRLRGMTSHTIVGEMGFYRKIPRSATVIAEEPSVVYRLTREAFDSMHAQDPNAAAALHQLIIRVLSDRWEFANRETAALV